MTRSSPIGSEALKSAGSSPSDPYLGVFLDPQATRILVAWWATVVQKPFLPDLKADHLTLAFKPNRFVFERFSPFIGAMVRLDVLGWAADDRAQAVFTTCPLPCLNKRPHITISVASGESGFHSNELEDVRPCPGPSVTGLVGLRT